MAEQNMIAKACYLVGSIKARLFGKGMRCPNCGEKSNTVVDRKWIFTTLRRCPGCRLLFRTPCTPKKEQREFYQKAYAQGFTTELPNDDDLANLIKTGFQGTPRDYQDYLCLLKNLGLSSGATILEFGCSWGYGAWQMRKAGYEVTAYEISKPRCQYARQKLGIPAFQDLTEIQKKFDVVFSAHVLEHVDSLEQCLSDQWKRVRPGGFLVGVTPNGSSVFQMAKPKNFHHLWGLVHPQLLDEQFLFRYFGGREILVSSLPCKKKLCFSPRAESLKEIDLKGWELFFIVKKQAESKEEIGY